MLHSDLAKRAEVELDVARQRVDLASLYISSIGQGALSETAEGDVAVAASSMEVQNIESAYSLARIAAGRIDQEMAQARQRRIQLERGLRLPVALVVIVVPLVLLILREFTEPERRSREALQVLEGVIPVFDALHDDLGLARAWRLLGDVYWNRSRYKPPADPFGQIDGNCEADALIAAGCTGDRRVDSDHVATKVNQGAAAVAGIDGRVGLQKLLAG
jgi:hypothetical protein